MIFKTSNFGIFLLFQVPPKIMKYTSLYNFFPQIKKCKNSKLGPVTRECKAGVYWPQSESQSCSQSHQSCKSASSWVKIESRSHKQSYKLGRFGVLRIRLVSCSLD